MPQATMEVLGLEKIKLRKFVAAMGNLSQPLRQALVYLKLKNIFDAREGRKIIGGKKFKRYKESYIESLSMKGLYGGKKWLWLSGRMMRGMSIRVGRTRGQVGYWNKDKPSMLAHVHQFGTRPKGKFVVKGGKRAVGLTSELREFAIGSGTWHIPPRPWFGWRKGYKEYIENQIMWPWIRGEVNKAGLEFHIGI